MVQVLIPLELHSIKVRSPMLEVHLLQELLLPQVHTPQDHAILLTLQVLLEVQ